MTREEIISGLRFTIEMFLFDPSTGEVLTEPRNDMDKTTIDACKGAIELLEHEPRFILKADGTIEQIKQVLKAGCWILTDSDLVYCSECGRTLIRRENYCPNCGARMESEE